MERKVDSIVIGEGWAALGAVGFLAQAGRRVHWIAGTGARALSPTASIEAGMGAFAWRELTVRLGIDAGELQTGTFLREFRNKSFREPQWVRTPNYAMRVEARDELLWEPETRFAGAFEARFDAPLSDVEEAVRATLLMHPNVTRREAVPLQGFRTEGEGKNAKVAAVILGSGEEVACDHIIYADKWLALIGLEGLPKPIPFLRGREPMGMVQTSFTHCAPMPQGLQETFYGPIQRESGEDFQRNVFGFFSADGLHSVWSVMLSRNEVEDNHEIAKKLRRMKQALEKMFVGGDWLPEGKADFMANVEAESVHFEEAILFGEGKVSREPLTLPKTNGLYFLTDGYGPSVAMEQVARLLGELTSLKLEDAEPWVNAQLELHTGPTTSSS